LIVSKPYELLDVLACGGHLERIPFVLIQVAPVTITIVIEPGNAQVAYWIAHLGKIQRLEQQTRDCDSHSDSQLVQMLVAHDVKPSK
jgi:hypothetical protein